MKILLVDDDQSLLELLSFLVQRAEFRPIVATNGSSALQLLEDRSPDMLLLDIGLGDDDGLQVLETIRRFSDVPIIMVSARDSEDDIERALELGADDYVTKPFGFRELVARIRAVLRRKGHPRPVQPVDFWMRVGLLALNPREHKATLDGLPVALTPTEFRLLQVLVENADSVVPYRLLQKQVWGYNDPTATELVRAAVLRRKLVDIRGQPVIGTISGVGVVLRRTTEQAETVFIDNMTIVAD